MTKKGLQAELKKLGVGGWNTKTTKGALEILLKDHVGTDTSEKGDVKKFTQSPTSETRDQNNKRPRVGVKQILYRLFTEDPELVIAEQELITKHLPGRKPSSIRTWTGKGGLGSSKYGMVVDGVVNPIMVTRDKEGNYSRQS